MPNTVVISLSALAALLPALFLSQRAVARDRGFWAALALGVAGPAALVGLRFHDSWHTGLGAALWVTVALCMAMFAALSAASRSAGRLAPLVLPCLLALGLAATVAGQSPERPLASVAPGPWVTAHILLSVSAYALLTLAAVAGVSVFLQERALRTKSPSALTRSLPSMVDGERLQFRLMAATLAVLGLALATGMATEYGERGRLLILTHKTLFSLLTFAVVAVLLLAHGRTGLRGRRAARLVLLAYLLLSLGYLGVKLVGELLTR